MYEFVNHVQPVAETRCCVMIASLLTHARPFGVIIVTVSPDFIPWMTAEVATWADRYGCEPHRAFPAWAVSFIFDVEDDDAFNQTETLAQGDAGIDGWYYDRTGLVFHLIQAKYLNDPVNGLVSPGDLDSLLKAALLLKNPANIESGPHHERLTTISLALEEALLDDASISLDVVIAGRLSENGEQLLREAASAIGPNYSLAVYDTEGLDELKLADDPIDDLAEVRVEFAVAGDDGYFEVRNLDLPGVGDAAVATLDGRSLADAVDKWQARLFHGNVRYYLRRSNRINKRMLETLDSEEGRKAFWLYNNGLTIVADSFEFETDQSGVKLIATNPQIVNGAQTSSVLRERRAHLSHGDVAVQCRIIAVADDQAGKDALERISEFTNSQSPVKPADLRSNDLRHRKLQASFRMLPEPVFYERRRGEWQSLPPAVRASFAGRKVSKEDIGQRFLAFQGSPAEAVTKKESIFGELEAIAFDGTVSAHVFMLAHLLYEQADSLMKASASEDLFALVPGLNTPISSDPDVPTQIVVLRRARALVCAHAVALAHDALRWRYTDIGPVRAEVLRKRLTDTESDTYKFVWRYVFRSIRNWFTPLGDKSALKLSLQRTDSLAEIRAVLNDILVEANASELPAL